MKLFGPKRLSAPDFLKLVRNMLEAAKVRHTHEDNTIGIPFGTDDCGLTKIEVQELDIRTHDGLDLDLIVYISTDYSAVWSELPLQHLCNFNAMAGLSGLLVVDGKVLLGSRLPVFRNEKELVAYADLVMLTALLQPIWNHRMLAMYTDTEERLPQIASVVGDADAGPMWEESDLKGIATRFIQHGLFANAFGSALTAEFPWPPGSRAAFSGGDTCLFSMETTRNPILGDGMFYKLEFPSSLPPNDLPKITMAMNVDEWGGTDAAPFFGAWCPSRSGPRIAFVGFMPNALRHLSLHQSVAAWCLTRWRASASLWYEAVVRVRRRQTR
jgi:hypothetical protein